MGDVRVLRSATPTAVIFTLNQDSRTAARAVCDPLHWEDPEGRCGHPVTFPFDPQQGLIVVPAELRRPTGGVVLRLAMDTGAAVTLVNIAMLVGVGYDPALAPTRVQVTTGSGVEYAPRVMLSRIRALGQERIDFDVVGHTRPPSARVDGLLGLDFFRGQSVTIDFRAGRVILA